MDRGTENTTDGRLAAGARVYEGMSNVQKQMLREHLSCELGPTTEWREAVSQRVSAVLRRRAQGGESLDADDIIGEVLPFCRSIIPRNVREGLFRRVSETLGMMGENSFRDS